MKRRISTTHDTTTRLMTILLAAALGASCGDDAVEPITPTTVTVSPASASLQSLGEIVQLTATVQDQNGQAMSGITVMWTSGDTELGTVSPSGLVTAVANGTVRVTAKAGSVSGSATVTIQQVPADVAVASDSLVLGAIGDTTRVKATFADANGHAIADAGAEWVSADPAVATVDGSGLVTAVANGTVAVTAAAGSVSGSVSVTVDQIPAEVLVQPAADTLVASGDTLRLSADALDSNGNAVAGAVFAWASTDTLVAVVDDEGLVTGVSAGEVDVTATSNGSTGRAHLTVAAPVPTTVAVSPDTVAFSALGQTAQLAAEVRDQVGRAMEGEPVSWTSGDTLVATVDSTGLVTATGTGATTVAATAGSASTTAVVTVTQSAGRVVVSPPAATIGLGDTLRLTAAAFDENGHVVADAEFDWSSSDLSVARVDGSGLVTAVAEGRATVTVEADGARATAELTVENPDRAALVAIYNATDGPNWVDNTNWLTDAPLGHWYGVTTDASGWVIRLDLSGVETSGHLEPHGLYGEVPPQLGDLANLRHLDLQRNQLWGPVPPELAQLGNLKTLSLAWNDLWGPIPPELGQLTNLERLQLSQNYLDGVIPPELGGMASLRGLSVHDNDLSGPIPLELVNLTNLEKLHLGGNSLSGPIPPELGGMASLRELAVQANELSGPIPSQLGNLSELNVLSFAVNRLSGTIPPELGNLSKLTWFNFGANLLSGPIPHAFLNLRLDGFGVHCAYYGACVPGTSEFVEWVNGIELFTDVPFCNASDQIALIGLFNATGGEKSWTDSEGWLGGPALEEWHGVETDSAGRVTALDLSDNGLVGSLPAGMANFSELTTLRIDGNDLGGRLPLGLTVLDLDEFHYDGTDLCEPDDAEFRRWLEGIPSHQGASGQCPPLTEREAMALLYESMGGPSWNNSDGWLTGAPLGSWYGVSVDSQGQVVGLSLGSNNLSGTLPPELGGLSNLRWLNLEGAGLRGEIPKWLEGLSNLEELSISNNEFSGEIPPWLGQLPNLISLDLRSNDLTGTIPPELGSLARLYYLKLSNNNLTGEIPAELGGLTNLRRLHLGSNELTGGIPAELGGLTNLRRLYLGSNELTGGIPAELGGLSNLRRLSVSQNALSGMIPTHLGRLTNLTELELSHNARLAGAIPSGLIDAELETLLTSGTELCAPRGPSFQDWLATIPRGRIALCGERPAAYLVQAVQSRAHPVPLVAGEDALLRVFVTGAVETSEGIPDIRARFYIDGAERHVAEIAGSATPIPTGFDEGELSKSANVEVPGRFVRPGLEIEIEIDPDGTLDERLGVPRRIPEVGRLSVEVREMPVFDLTVIPFIWDSDPDLAVVGMVNAMAADPETHPLLEETHVLLPVAEIEVTAHARVASSSNSVFDLLAQTEAIRVLEGGRGYYKGMMSGGFADWWGGIAHLGGRASVSGPYSGTIAHELGHNMGLRHAPCGGAGGPDPSFPDPRGAIGTWGYDFRRGAVVPRLRRDHMSYCDPTWTSDYHFTNALRHRLAAEGTAAMAGQPTASLLLWGGVDATGVPFLEPAFVAQAPPALPDSAGDWSVTGRDASGRELFALSFAMPVAQSEAGRVSSFAFMLPVQFAWDGNLASITLDGPEGTATLEEESDVSMAIVRDPVTGQVRGFLRDLPPQTQAAMDAAESAIEPGLQILFSRGIPDASQWRR